jgi:hypothetical protein
MVDELNTRFPMVGLSADWVYRTWLVKGNEQEGVVIFENEDDSVFEVIEFFYVDEERIENVLFGGDLYSALSLIKEG